MARYNKRHGHRGDGTTSPTYYSWHGMKARCNNPNHISFPQYGGSGITVGEEFNQFEDFLEWMGERPEGTTLDRIDSKGNYVAGNVRWSTLKEQISNRKIAKNNTSGYKGVYKVKDKYVAQLKIDGKSTHLGTFTYPWTASMVYEGEKKKRESNGI